MSAATAMEHCPTANTVEQIVRTLALYALAECQEGNASTIEVTASGLSFSVSDNGRGHSPSRTVEGSPYTAFICTHLDYPFPHGEGGPVQLQGLTMSLLNTLCSELHVVARSTAGTVQLSHCEGKLQSMRANPQEGQTSNKVWGTVRPELELQPVDEGSIRRWLRAVFAANDGAAIRFNGGPLVPDSSPATPAAWRYSD